MRLFNIIALLAVAGLARYGWQQYHAHEVEASVSGSSFVDVVQPDGFPARGVVIMAPENCPSEQAQNAEALFEKLKQAGVPVTKSSEFSISPAGDLTGDVRAAMDRTMAVAQGKVPIVFIGKRGKANPSFDEVVAEYRSQKHS